MSDPHKKEDGSVLSSEPHLPTTLRTPLSHTRDANATLKIALASEGISNG